MLTSANIAAREIELDSFDSGDNGKHTDIGCVEISEIVAMQDAFFFGSEPF